MKVVLLFLFSLVVCQPHQFHNEERKKDMMKIHKEMTDCILSNNTISEEFRKEAELNKADELRKPPVQLIEKLKPSDREVIRYCRKKIFERIRQSVRASFDNGFHMERRKLNERMTKRKHRFN